MWVASTEGLGHGFWLGTTDTAENARGAKSMLGRLVTGTWYLDAPDDRECTRASDAKRRHNEHFARRSTPARSASHRLTLKTCPEAGPLRIDSPYAFSLRPPMIVAHLDKARRLFRGLRYVRQSRTPSCSPAGNRLDPARTAFLRGAAGVRPTRRTLSCRGLTFEVRRDRRQDARPARWMIASAASRAWWLAVGPRLERRVRRH